MMSTTTAEELPAPKGDVACAGARDEHVHSQQADQRQQLGQKTPVAARAHPIEKDLRDSHKPIEAESLAAPRLP